MCSTSSFCRGSGWLGGSEMDNLPCKFLQLRNYEQNSQGVEAYIDV
jgi:hypothetical protein